MTIDINELRNDAKTAHYGHLPLEVPGSEMLELLDRLKAAESEAIEQARLNGMGSEREAALMAKLEAAEKELAELRSSMKFRTSLIGRTEAERDALRSKIAEMERQEPVAWAATDETRTVVESLGMNQSRRFDPPLFLAAGAQSAPNAVAYLDLGVGGYMDIGTDLTGEELATLPEGRHMLGIVGTYGIDGYFPAQPAPSVPEGWQLVPTAESRHPGIYKMLGALHAADNTPGMSEWESYRAMLSEAPEAKP